MTDKIEINKHKGKMPEDLIETKSDTIKEILFFSDSRSGEQIILESSTQTMSQLITHATELKKRFGNTSNFNRDYIG